MPEKPATEKTEQPTPKKLRKAKEEGQVPQSQELASVISIVILVAAIALLAPNLMRWITLLIKEGMSCNNQVFADSGTFMKFINEKIMNVILLISPILAALIVGSVISGMAVSGPNFATKAVKLDLKAINPVAGFQKLFNAKSAVKLIASILKLFFVGLIVWFYLHDKLANLAALRWAWSAEIMTGIAELILGLMIRVCVALIIIGIADTIYQKWKHIQDLKMTRQEVKEERKDTEGSPQVKARIRKIQYQTVMKRMLQEVPKANVVLVNPTHFAVALRYDTKTMESPILVAKGADYMAEKIREIARAYGVPIIRRPELARAIYSSLQPGDAIPQKLYIAVAEVLALIYRLRQRKLAAR